jgi:hypothetical protein
MSTPFVPLPHATQSALVSAAVTQLSIQSIKDSAQLWVDNRGVTDLLIEFHDAPVDGNSFRVGARCAQPITIPDNATFVYLKRPAGSADGQVFITVGRGF